MHRHRAYGWLMVLVVIVGAGVLLTPAPVVPVQSGPSDAKDRGTKKLIVGEEVERLKAGSISARTLQFLADQNAAEAIPVLERQFELTDEKLDKAKIAQVLVKLRSKNKRYWEYLSGLVARALDDNAPDFLSTSKDGRTAQRPSPEFLAWAKARNLDVDQAGEEELYVRPAYVVMLGLTEDPRAKPLLRRALLADNSIIGACAAKGLAQLQDREAVSIMLEVAEKRPAEVKRLLAEAMVYFDDHRAQAAVDRWLSKEQADQLRQAVREGRKPLQ